MADDTYERPALEKARFHTHLTENLDEDWTKPGTVRIDPDSCLPAHEVFRRDRRVQKQFWFLFVAVFGVGLVFGVLAQQAQTRSEMNQQQLVEQEKQIQVAIYNGCLHRVELAKQYNAQQETSLPVENCGAPPAG